MFTLKAFSEIIEKCLTIYNKKIADEQSVRGNDENILNN
jgi:hypothetical protein